MLVPVNNSCSHIHNNAEENKPLVVGMHYRVGPRIGEGSFGTIHAGRCTLTDRLVAIKFEPRTAASHHPNSSMTPQLGDEWRSYKILEGVSPNIPKAYYYGAEGNFWCLVMDLQGPSLESLFEQCKKSLSIGCICNFAIQMITLIEAVHSRGLIYRDIKPDNFLLSLRDDRLCLVDFGMAKWYRDPKTSKHIPYRERKSLSGTARYMSINTHLGKEQSRRDDLEALGHVFFYLARGSLPWQGLKANSHREKCDLIAFTKQNTSMSTLLNQCERPIPTEFAQYLQYARSLDFDEDPDYEKCRDFFRPYALAKLDFDFEQLQREFTEKCSTAVSVRNPQSIVSRYEDCHEEATGTNGGGRKKSSWFSRLFCFSSRNHKK